MNNENTDLFSKGKVLLIDKPPEWTSFDVVNKIRNTIKKYGNIKKIKVGHAGTLDPLATGLLIICTGKFTKKIEEYQAQEKEYTGKITLGITTPSYDLETNVDNTFPTTHITEELILETAEKMEGNILQTPPAFSAKKVDGETAYIAARKGRKVALKPNPVTIYNFDIVKIKLPDVYFRIVCSKGTYIRSIAHDFGKLLQSGGCLSELRRTRIGNYSVEDAWSIEQAVKNIQETFYG